MSSKSQNEGQKQSQPSRSKRNKKPVHNPPPDKKSRRGRKKNPDSSLEYVPPSQVPFTDSQSILTFQSFEHETTKLIIQIPIVLFKTEAMAEEAKTRIASTNLTIRVRMTDCESIVVEAKIDEQVGGMVIEIEDDEEEDRGKTFSIWGRVSWMGMNEVITKINKHALKVLFDDYTEIQKVKTKEVNSDIFITINLKEKIDCVSNYNGLINQGNTCYMNSYLQMLYHIAEFRNLVYEAKVHDENKFPATLQILFYRLDHDQKAVSADQLVKSFGWSKKEAQIQQDAQEFSCVFFEVLEKKLNEVITESEHLNMEGLFRGNLEHKISCTQVDYESIKIESFIDLQLDLSESLEVALDHYVAPQLLSGDNMYATCEFGKQEAEKSVRIKQLPPILMIQLKRFEFSAVTYKNEKITTRFEYPNEIDFGKWMVEQNNSQMYELYGVLVHEGIKAESGHYYVYLKSEGAWYKFNDQEVTFASQEQVFEYNYGGELEVIDLESRELKVRNRKIICSSTAYMLVYVKKEMAQPLLNCQIKNPAWLLERETTKQEEKEELKLRKNYYHDIELMDWNEDLLKKSADYIGLLPRDVEDMKVRTIEKIPKAQKVNEWVAAYNEKGMGVFFYQTYNDKTEYETLVNLQHRKSTFLDVIKEPGPFLIFLQAPIQPKVDNYLFFVKLMTLTDGKHNITFDWLFEFPRNKSSAELLEVLREKYEEQGFKTRYYYEEKKQISAIMKETNLVKGPLTSRNILCIVIVEKIEVGKAELANPTRKWYSNLKNNVEIVVRSDDQQYEDEVVLDQSIPLKELREYIFQKIVKDDDGYVSAENIVLKGKLKKSSKNFMEMVDAKTVKDLIKNCDRDRVIYFCSSNLNTQERLSQVEVKFQYRFQDFTFSDQFHIILNKGEGNAAVDIYDKLVNHPSIHKFLQAQQLKGIRVFLFNKNRNVINDIVSENGYITGKGEVNMVLQKEKGSHLIIQGCEHPKIKQDHCPILLHHKSLTGDKIGKPRYLEVDRSIKLVDLHTELIELMKNQEYEWEEKVNKFNPFKVYIWAYGKDIAKGIQIMDEEAAIQQAKSDAKIEEDARVGEEVTEKAERGKEEEEKVVQGQKEQMEEQNNEEIVKSASVLLNTIESVFPKIKVLKVVVQHQNLVKVQNQLKINVE